MADDNNQRQYRPNDMRTAPETAAANDPLAELARLIGQTDPFAEFGRSGARGASVPKQSDWQTSPPVADEYARSAPGQPDMTQAQSYQGADFDGQSYAPPYASGAGLYRDDTTPAGGFEAGPFYQDDEHGTDADEFYDDAPPPRRRIGLIALSAIFALAVVGTVGAISYRSLFGSSGAHGTPPVIKADTTPSKVVPSTSGKDAGKTITDRVGDRGQNEKLVSREEQPVAMPEPSAMAGPVPNSGVQPSAPLMPANGSGIVASEPKKIHTIVIRPDQAGMPDAAQATVPPQSPPSPSARIEAASKPVSQPTRVASAPQAATAAVAEPAMPEPRPATRAVASAAPVAAHRSANAPLSLNPGDASAPAPARQVARAAAPSPAPAPQEAEGGGYAVQVSSQRSEAEAEAAFRNIQAKYPDQLGGRKPMIHRVDLGAKGIYFRAMIGPFANSADATSLCSSLKSAGGQCIVQKI